MLVAQKDYRKNPTSDFTVSAADFVRNFAKWREAAHSQPVYITNHGRSSHVLTTIDFFDRLNEITGSEDLSQASLFGLADWVDEAIVVCNEHEHVVFANRLATAKCGIAPISPGKKLIEMIPSLGGTLAEVQYRRTLDTREASSVDLPSPFSQGGWLNLRCFPLRELTVLMLKDITEDVERYRLADVKEAMLHAISLQETTGYLRVSLRGTIERADESFCKWIGLDEDRINGVQLIDMVSRKDRVKFRDHLEEILTGAGPVVLDTKFTPNHAGELALRCSIVGLHGAYGTEGAVIVLQRRG